ncbi:MAG TPA: hypothetical protein VKB56_03105, partial [Terriglobales bacterium]|nr:hypothetical protein [Terriglobales bacterium]
MATKKKSKASRPMASRGRLRRASTKAVEGGMAAVQQTPANGDAAKWVGQRFKRKEDPRLIQGISHYADDLRLPGMLLAAFVRSPHANAKIASINIDAARSAPGVV